MIGWLDCSSGVSGDMLLGALVDAGVPLAVMQAAVDAVAPEPVRLRAQQVRRGGLRALQVHVDAAPSAEPRAWADVRALLGAAALPAPARRWALAAFTRLADAEAAVHATTADAVHFHEVGALDAIADVVAAGAGLAHLDLAGWHCSTVAVGGGSVRAAHGTLPVPAPAVVELLRGYPSRGGPVDVELATPTGAAVLTALVPARHAGVQPAMAVTSVGVGAGGRDLLDRANVVRLLLGEPAGTGPADTGPEHADPADADPADADPAGTDPAGTDPADGDGVLQLETNVDDLDPRVWPGVLDRLLRAGASDAWLTPILMKKGRPAHTLHVLVAARHAAAARRVVFTETSAIGLRAHRVTKHALRRREELVDVSGQPVRVKLALLDGRVVNAQPEHADVAAAAAALDRPLKQVLAAAVAAAHPLTGWDEAGG